MNAIKRHVENRLGKTARSFPALWITGPRQAGKTTLAKRVFGSYTYVSFEDMDMRSFAKKDPRAFLRQFSDRVILDEVQKCPDILSYLQTHIDELGGSGHYVLTGSHQFQLAASISQSLAGRVAIVNLLPFSLSERYGLTPVPVDSTGSAGGGMLPAGHTLEKILFQGMYPAIHSRKIDATAWLSSYYATYLERDVREVTSVHNLHQFDTFVRLCAARTGNMVNFTEISSSCGASLPTIKSWLSILEMSGIIKLVQPYFVNFSKRLVKTPKLYFLDTGLLCYLLRIADESQLAFHSLKGRIFESFIVSEVIKSFCNALAEPPVYFWRDSKGREIDLLLDLGRYLWPVEIKASETVSDSFFDTLNWWFDLPGNRAKNGTVVYGGKGSQRRGAINVRSWRQGF
ncbi:MAG: ATP-binding protein [Chitinispirillaceae bacterium]|nr:ATP-binding protein [Chitinispirillaceae bacterium]